MTKSVYYAVGDIHGQAESLKTLHRRIAHKHQKDFPNNRGTIIHLGDYVDRGPDSFGAIECILALEKDNSFNVINLKGNHEQLMLEGCRRGEYQAFSNWRANGGEATLQSYKTNGFDDPCEHHLNWMEKLPSMHWNKEAGYIFVHAGVDPRTFPHEDEKTRLWTRSEAFFDPSKWQSPSLNGMTVVHGHTPTDSDNPEISRLGRRVNVDTGACYGGPLTAAVLAPERDIEFLQV